MAGLLQGIIQFQLGPKLFIIESFPAWFLVANIFSLLGAFFLLKYFHHKQYPFTMVAGILATLATLGLSLVIYQLLWSGWSGWSGALKNWYVPALFLSLLTGLVYSLSLMVPRPEKILI